MQFIKLFLSYKGVNIIFSPRSSLANSKITYEHHLQLTIISNKPSSPIKHHFQSTIAFIRIIISYLHPMIEISHILSQNMNSQNDFIGFIFSARLEMKAILIFCFQQMKRIPKNSRKNSRFLIIFRLYFFLHFLLQSVVSQLLYAFLPLCYIFHFSFSIISLY
jgi:hypothetical protein